MGGESRVGVGGELGWRLGGEIGGELGGIWDRSWKWG